MTKPLVSILIPAFNAEKWIGDTLRSALAQTWKPTEIVVVDDGSTDRTLEVLRQFDSSVRLISQPNQGAAAARNKAFSVCRGDYLQWLDADDLLAPTKIERQMQAALNSSAGTRTLLSSAFARFMYRPRPAQFIPTALWCDLSKVEWLVRKMEHNLYMQTATWLVSRELTEAAGPWDTTLLGDDDGEYFCRVLLASDGVRFVHESRVYYRVCGFNRLSYIVESKARIEAHWRSMQLHVRYLMSLEDSPKVRAACTQYLRTSLTYFYPEHRDISMRIVEMASSLGDQLSPPRVSWKYSWIKALFGWTVAKRAQFLARRTRWWVAHSWDKALFQLERTSSCGWNPEKERMPDATRHAFDSQT